MFKSFRKKLMIPFSGLLLGIFVFTMSIANPVLAVMSADFHAYQALQNTAKAMESMRSGHFELKAEVQNLNEHGEEIINISGNFDQNNIYLKIQLPLYTPFNSFEGYVRIQDDTQSAYIKFDGDQGIFEEMPELNDVWIFFNEDDLQELYGVDYLDSTETQEDIVFKIFQDMIKERVITFDQFVFDSLEGNNDVYRMNFTFNMSQLPYHFSTHLQEYGLLEENIEQIQSYILKIQDQYEYTGSIYTNVYTNMLSGFTINLKEKESNFSTKISFSLSQLNQILEFPNPEKTISFIDFQELMYENNNLAYDYDDNFSLVDSDEDGLSDMDEIRYNTDRYNPDTDKDGYPDGLEIANGYNPLGAGKIDQMDTDQDGLTDMEEYFYKTDYKDPDTDGDGYPDGLEVMNGYNPLGIGKMKS